MLNKLRLAKKLYIGFGVLLMLLIFIAVVSIYELKGASNGSGSYREMTRGNVLASRVQVNTLMFRMNVNDFITT